MFCCLNRLQNQSLATRVLVLAITVFVVFAAVAPVAACRGGAMALVAAATGGSLCLAGATCALIASRRLRGPQLALHSLLVGMMLRLSIPLGIGLALYLRSGPLAEAGLLYYLLMFYMVTLTVETALSLPPSRQTNPPTPRPSKGAS